MWKLLAGLCLLLALGGGTAVMLREDVGEDLARELEDQDLAAVLADAPPLDADLQERLWRWMLDHDGWPGGWSWSQDVDWFLEGSTQPPARVVEEHDRLREGMAELTEMLDTDRACLTSLGWLGPIVRSGARKPFYGFELRLPNVLKTSGAARWYAHEALSASDPRKPLDRLDRLLRALSYGGTLHDRFQSWHVSRTRDRTWLFLLLRGRAPRERVEAWLAEPSNQIERLVQDVRLDRFLYAASIGQDVRERRYADSDADLSVGDRLGWWWRGAGDVAAWLQLCRMFEAYLRGRATAEAVQSLKEARQPRIGRPMVSGKIHGLDLERVVACDAAHRRPRIAGRVLLLFQKRGRLPRDDRELRAWMGAGAALLDPGPFRLGLVYEWLAPDLFLVRVNPTTPIPDLLGPESRGRLLEYHALERLPDIALPRWDAACIVIRLPRS